MQKWIKEIDGDDILLKSPFNGALTSGSRKSTMPVMHQITARRRYKSRFYQFRVVNKRFSFTVVNLECWLNIVSFFLLLFYSFFPI